ncbi:MAG TPA: hypothetical protein PL052_06710 [Synergistales bacterium]|nr:hypothetical protein [Synergistales bacterium]
MKLIRTAVLPMMMATALLLVSGAVFAQGGCGVPGELKVVLTGAEWEFDLKTGRLSGEAVVKNVCDGDVVAPGIMVGIYGVNGEMVNNLAQRGTEMRLAPGKSVKVKFRIDLKEAPASLMFAPFEGMTST